MPNSTDKIKPMRKHTSFKKSEKELYDYVDDINDFSGTTKRLFELHKLFNDEGLNLLDVRPSDIKKANEATQSNTLSLEQIIGLIKQNPNISNEQADEIENITTTKTHTDIMTKMNLTKSAKKDTPE